MGKRTEHSQEERRASRATKHGMRSRMFKQVERASTTGQYVETASGREAAVSQGQAMPSKKAPTAKKAPAKKTVAKKAPAKKAPAKTVAKKAPAKKTVAKKAPAKKAEARNTAEVTKSAVGRVIRPNPALNSGYSILKPNPSRKVPVAKDPEPAMTPIDEAMAKVGAPQRYEGRLRPSSRDVLAVARAVGVEHAELMDRLAQ